MNNFIISTIIEINSLQKRNVSTKYNMVGKIIEEIDRIFIRLCYVTFPYCTTLINISLIVTVCELSNFDHYKLFVSRCDLEIPDIETR